MARVAQVMGLLRRRPSSDSPPSLRQVTGQLACGAACGGLLLGLALLAADWGRSPGLGAAEQQLLTASGPDLVGRSSDPAATVDQESSAFFGNRGEWLGRLGLRVGSGLDVTAEGRYQELRVNIESDRTVNGISSVVTIAARRVSDGHLAHHRSAELSPDELLVVAIDSAHEVRWFSTVSDPRVMRAESPDEAGRLSGSLVMVPHSTALLMVPYHPEIVSVGLYHRSTSGDQSKIELVGSVNLR